MKQWVAAGLILLLVGCGNSRESTEIANHRKPLLDNMFDPGSAQFRNERLVRVEGMEGATLCGEFNAKNTMGGYVGFTRFIAHSDGALIEGAVNTFPGTPYFDRMVSLFCTEGQTQESFMKRAQEMREKQWR